jgi:site-specific DNA-methyltransferase (adenine-specific)
LIHAQTKLTINARTTIQKLTTGLKKIGGGHAYFATLHNGTEIKKWVEKSFRESHKANTIVVMLIPARTDTSYFHDYILHRSEIRFIKGRLKFGDSKSAAPFPSMLVIFRSAGTD